MKLHLIVGLIILGLVGTIELQRRTNTTLKANIATEKNNVKNLEEKYQQEKATVESLQQQEREKLKQQAQLAAAQRTLENIAYSRLQKIQELQDEIDVLRQWAEQPLPDVIVRLRQRPAITGVDGYCKHLQHAGTLPIESSQCAF